jgi:hypothetical protein
MATLVAKHTSALHTLFPVLQRRLRRRWRTGKKWIRFIRLCSGQREAPPDKRLRSMPLRAATVAEIAKVLLSIDAVIRMLATSGDEPENALSGYFKKLLRTFTNPD